MAALKVNALSLQSQEITEITFLPNALPHIGILHFFSNALQEAFEDVTEWDTYLSM